MYLVSIALVTTLWQPMYSSYECFPLGVDVENWWQKGGNPSYSEKGM
jgi:hypothetical protein